MIIVKIREGVNGAFKNVDDAINYFYQLDFSNKTYHEIQLYDISRNDAGIKAKKLYDAIVEYNKGKPLDQQILPSNPYECRGIIGCLGVSVMEILLGTYERNHNAIAVFTGWNESVLCQDPDKEIDVRPSLKALYFLGMVGGYF